MSGMPVAQQSTSLLRNRNFLLLWSGQSFSLVGDYFFSTTIILWLIEQFAKGENWLPLATSGVALSATIPSLLLSPVAGVYVDRWDRRATMIWTDVARFILILLFWLLTTLVADHTVLLMGCFVILLLVACGSQFFLPARVALVADLVPQEKHPGAYGSLQQAMYVAQILGPSVAAPLYVVLGPVWAIVLNASSFLVSFLLLAFIHEPERDLEKIPKKENFWYALRGGGKFFVESRVLVALTASTMLYMFGGMAFNALEYLYGAENLHIPVHLLGLYIGCYGVGIVIGLPVMATLVKSGREVTFYWLSLIVNGLALLVLSRLTTMIPAMICEVVSGLLSASILMVRHPLTVLVTPRELVGRVSAIQGLLITLASVLGGSLAGLLAVMLSGLHAQIAGVAFGSLDSILLGIGFLTIGTGVFVSQVLSPAVKAYWSG